MFLPAACDVAVSLFRGFLVFSFVWVLCRSTLCFGLCWSSGACVRCGGEFYFILLVSPLIVSTYVKKCCDSEKVAGYVRHGLCHLGYSIFAIRKQHLPSTYMSENSISLTDSRHCIIKLILGSRSNYVEHISEEVTNNLDTKNKCRPNYIQAFC
jgi:hypothetical protein